MGFWDKLRDQVQATERCEEASCSDRPEIADGKLKPPDRAEIGRAAWRYVHSRAVDYPEQPSPQEIEREQNWIASFIQTYPCQHCAHEFVEICAQIPPDLSGRDNYVMWWCKAHNGVRDDLSQDVDVKCNLKDLLAAGRAGIPMGEWYKQCQAKPN